MDFLQTYLANIIIRVPLEREKLVEVKKKG